MSEVAERSLQRQLSTLSVKRPVFFFFFFFSLVLLASYMFGACRLHPVTYKTLLPYIKSPVVNMFTIRAATLSTNRRNCFHFGEGAHLILHHIAFSRVMVSLERKYRYSGAIQGLKSSLYGRSWL